MASLHTTVHVPKDSMVIFLVVFQVFTVSQHEPESLEESRLAHLILFIHLTISLSLSLLHQLLSRYEL